MEDARVVFGGIAGQALAGEAGGGFPEGQDAEHGSDQQAMAQR